MNLRRLPALPHWLIPSARLRIAITYAWGHRRLPRLYDPRRFTELVQQRKLADRDPLLTVLSDKIAAKPFVRDVLGDAWIIPTLWSGIELPADPPAPCPFILKASHGCNQNAVCRTPDDWPRIRRLARGWTRRPYGLWLDEWAYRGLPRGYLAEPYLGGEGTAPVDYKVYVFGGRAEFVQVHLDRGTNHRWLLHDRDWRQVSRPDLAPVPPPVTLTSMLAAAERLAAPFEFARVDFYEIDGEAKFGEITFYPGSGLDPFDPVALDLMLGERWLAARAAARLRDAA